MLVLAMREGFGEIHLYGIDLLQDEEYFYQRAGAEYLIGLARGLGIRVYLPRQSALCKASYVYGYSEPPTDLKQLQPLVDFIELKANQSEDLMHKCASDAGVMDGASQAFKMFEGWLAAGKTKEEMLAELEVQKAKAAKKHRDLLDGVKTLIGQAEAFKTSTVWIKHVARGGVQYSKF